MTRRTLYPNVGVNAALAFASWLRAEHPTLYRQAAERADIAVEIRNQKAADRGLRGLGQEEDSTDGWFATFVQSAAALGTTFLSLRNQRDQMQMNIERAKMGLDPVDIGGTPIITTEVVLPPGTVDKITASAGMNINKILIFAGLAAAAFFFLR